MRAPVALHHVLLAFLWHDAAAMANALSRLQDRVFESAAAHANKRMVSQIWLHSQDRHSMEVAAVHFFSCHFLLQHTHLLN